MGSPALPLNIDDWTLFTIAQPNNGPLVNTPGFLDAGGEASAAAQIPADPSLIGIRADHAYVVVANGSVVAISGRVGLDLLP